jgi:hypothetical protein
MGVGGPQLTMALSWHPGPGPSFADDLSTYDFVTDSYLHGLSHTLRVMHHVLRIAAAGGPDLFPAQTVREAFCAALLHDTARRHDGHCELHGQYAVAEKLPAWRDRFLACGVTDAGLDRIAFAIASHCLPHPTTQTRRTAAQTQTQTETPPSRTAATTQTQTQTQTETETSTSSAAAQTLSLLRDADALDRVRFIDVCDLDRLDPRRLHHPFVADLEPAALTLFRHHPEATHWADFAHISL